MWNGTRSPPSLQQTHRPQTLGKERKYRNALQAKVAHTMMLLCIRVPGHSIVVCKMHNARVCVWESIIQNQSLLFALPASRKTNRTIGRTKSLITHTTFCRLVIFAANVCAPTSKTIACGGQRYGSVCRSDIYIYIFCAGPIRHFCMQLSTSYIHTAWYFTYIDLFFVRVFGVLPHAIYCRRCLLYDYY